MRTINANIPFFPAFARWLNTDEGTAFSTAPGTAERENSLLVATDPATALPPLTRSQGAASRPSRSRDRPA